LQVDVLDTEARLAQLRTRRQRQARKRLVRRMSAAAVALTCVAVLAFAMTYAGSSTRVAQGVTIAGVDVGGMTTDGAVRLLEQREAAIESEPVPVTVGGRTYQVRASTLGVTVHWRAAVRSALDKVDGFRPLRGFRRLATRAFGLDVTPSASADPKALNALLDRIGHDDVPFRDASIRLVGLQPVLISAKPGRAIDRPAARAAILGAFASLDRIPVELSPRTDTPRVTTATLQPALRKLRTVVSAPVQLTLGNARYTVSRRRLARLFELPAEGTTDLHIGGKAADAYFLGLQKDVNTPAKDAEFVPVPGGRVLVKPSQPSTSLDVPRTAEALLAAALRRPGRRVAPIVVGREQPDRTTADAQKMGITGLVSGYTTSYTGDPNRVHNVQLVADLIDDTLIAPGHVFSFNATTGERNAAKGFLEAPVIINGELQNGLGGGVCQVSTTVFNAAYEGGLDITARTNHALYISHYPQGRDATVNYPDTDLKFVNDTGHWLLLRTFVSSYSLTVNLYGTPQHRRVESETAPLVTTGKPPTTWKKDPTILKGTKEIAEAGSPARSTSVHRRVYDASGKLLHDDVWYSSYRGEKRVILVGAKPKPKPKPGKAATPGDQQPPTDLPTSGGGGI
jgi:vancomycin resistance protein YoaR